MNARWLKRIERRRLWTAVVVVLALLSVLAVYATLRRYHLKRFQQLRPGVFYRVAQPTERGLNELVRDHGIRTVVSLQLFDFRLRRGLLDPGEPSGTLESQYVERLGARHVQWPMGEEQFWPWLTPWQFDEFFRLVDDPANHPIVVHCMGGRHRTGTLAALFRLEYDRWTPDEALAEMYSFSFGGAIPWQEHNLRTYVPRPWPDTAQQAALDKAFAAWCPAGSGDYPGWIARLKRAVAEDGAARRAVTAYVADGGPFCLALAQRVIETADDPLAAEAVRRARSVLDDPQAALAELTAAAALVADFGARDDQQTLRDLLAGGVVEPVASQRFEALVDGVTNRYTQNRLAYLAPLLEDERQRVGRYSRAYRYCDTATIRIATITDRIRLLGMSDEQVRTEARCLARQLLGEHPALVELRPATTAWGRNDLRTQAGWAEEDLSRMRR